MATNYNFGAANELIGQNKVLIHVIIARPLRLRVISRTVHILSNIMTGVSWMGTFIRHRVICVQGMGAQSKDRKGSNFAA